ncbi:family 78 glycoside hydrolase catalytic domain [Paenibacillus sp. HB172176]|uniref:family 78 glycoside hydrolase catalytic domain n=1 Tax=Paenibacillus sp. HB172176 TaxID=2493690 RepID=UPI001438EDD2|nr:family 78 glycoside hydrolase catalytic domain [Paenibacillus sp. HB172176]
MDAIESHSWQARWIWSDGERSPRNEWLMFRKSFELDSTADMADTELKITADSRYVVFLNGKKLGFGPVRSWPKQLAYDCYSAGQLLKPGKNTIAVLVMHWGVTNFAYFRGRGGLLAELINRTSPNGSYAIVKSDDSWSWTKPDGYDSRAVRMSVQLAFAEVIDGRSWDENWMAVDFDDRNWLAANVIGDVGMEPWSNLQPRDIPFLTEEPVYPRKLQAVHNVKADQIWATVDIANHMMPETTWHLGPCFFSGYMATMLHAEEETSATICFLYGVPSAPLFVTLNGMAIDPDSYERDDVNLYINVALKQGDNFFLVDVSGAHRPMLQWSIGIKANASVQFVSPVDGSTMNGECEHSPFIAIGPFEAVDHQNPLGPKPVLGRDHPDELAVRTIQSWPELAVSMKEWISSVPSSLVTDVHVLGQCLWKDTIARISPDKRMEQLVIPSADKAVIETKQGEDIEIIIDFGEQRSGYLSFAVEASAGTILDFYGYEFQDERGIQHTYRLNNTLRYMCRDGFQSYESFVSRGFRYLMLTVRGNGEAVRFHDLKLIQSHYPVADTGEFQCSDDRLNRLWEISRRTVKLCMMDTFVDCPTYEQAYWVGDVRNVSLTHYYLFGDEQIVERCLRLVPGSRDQSPLYCSQVPSGWNNVIPNWTFLWIIACEEFVHRTGKTAFAVDILPDMAYTIAHYLNYRTDEGLLEIDAWNLLDWAPIDQPDSGVVTHQNMLLVKALASAAYVAREAGRQDLAADFAEQANHLKRAINKHLWSEEHQAYIDCIHADGRRSDILSMHSQVMALLCDIAEPTRKTVLQRYMTSPPSSFVPFGSPFMSFLYHEVLAELGLIKEIVDDIRNKWGIMLEYDATTCWETFPGRKEATYGKTLSRSHNHAWSAGPGYSLPKYVLGVQAMSSGFRQVVVAPQPGGLTWANGKVPIPGGDVVEVRWRATPDKKMDLTIHAPSHVQINPELPSGFTGEIRVIDYS